MQLNEMTVTRTQHCFRAAHAKKVGSCGTARAANTKFRSICVDRGAGIQPVHPLTGARHSRVQPSSGTTSSRTIPFVLSPSHWLKPCPQRQCPHVIRCSPATSPRCCRSARRFPVYSVLSGLFHRSPNAGKRGVFRQGKQEIL